MLLLEKGRNIFCCIKPSDDLPDDQCQDQDWCICRAGHPTQSTAVSDSPISWVRDPCITWLEWRSCPLAGWPLTLQHPQHTLHTLCHTAPHQTKHYDLHVGGNQTQLTFTTFYHIHAQLLRINPNDFWLQSFFFGSLMIINCYTLESLSMHFNT